MNDRARCNRCHHPMAGTDCWDGAWIRPCGGLIEAVPNNEISVVEIVAAYLLGHGYDGLYYDGPGEEGCGCTVGDLRPCDEDMSECKPGYKCDCGEDNHRFEGIGPARDEEVEANGA